MSPQNIRRARRMYAFGSSIGRIASCLNVSVLAVAYQLSIPE